jgi:hypothetical protein
MLAMNILALKMLSCFIRKGYHKQWTLRLSYDQFSWRYWYIKKQSPYTPRRPLGERRHSSYSFLTPAVDGDEWSALHFGRALPLGKGPPVPIGQEAGWAPEPVWTERLEEGSFRPCRGSNLDRPVGQTVARLYTDWATRLTTLLSGYANCENRNMIEVIGKYTPHSVFRIL